MNRLRLLGFAATAVSVIAVAAAVTSPVSAAPRPGAPSAVRAYQTAHGVRINWTNPAHSASVVVRYARGVLAPRTAGEGVVKRLGAHATSTTLHGLARNTRYSVSIWERDAAGHYSSRTVTRFTTPAPAEPTGTITGTVIDRGNRPLAAAHVDIYGYNGLGGTASARTDTRGRFAAHVPPGQYLLVVTGDKATGGTSDATGYETNYASVTVHAARTSRTTVLLPVGSAITGRAVAGDGSPLAGVTVQTVPAGAFVQPMQTGFTVYSVAFGPTSTAITRADGRFTLRGVAEASVRLCFSVGAAAHVAVTGVAPRCTDTTVAVESGTTRAAGDTVLASTHGGGLDVVVRGAHGTPLRQALVDAYRPAGGGDASSYTDAHGIVKLIGLAPGRYRVCAQQSSGGRVTTLSTGYLGNCGSATITAGATADVRLTLAVGAAVSGVVRGPGGHPVRNVGVELDGRNANGAGGYAVTDSFGHFTAVGLPTGTYRVCAAPAQGSAAAPRGTLQACYGDGARVGAVAGAVRTGIDISAVGGGAVAGTVRDAAGHRVSQVDVFASGANSFFFDNEATTDAAGRYAVAGLSSGTYQTCAHQFFYSGTTVQSCGRASVHVGHTTPLALRLPARGALQVRAAETDQTVPLLGVDAVLLKRCAVDGPDGEESGCRRVRAFDPSTLVSVVASAPTWADGTTALEGVPAGSYAVCMLGYNAAKLSGHEPVAGYADQCTSGFDVKITAGSQKILPTLSLSPGAGFSGRVTDTRGRPIAGVRVHVSTGGERDSSTGGRYDPYDDIDPADAVTAADGTYHVRSATPGGTTVCFDAVAAGTTRSGYLDQCVGGAPGHSDGGTTITLAAGTNADVDMALTSGPARRNYTTPRVQRPAHDARARTSLIAIDGKLVHLPTASSR